MRPVVVDTNVYIEAMREDEALARAERFYDLQRSRVHLHSVVVQELLAGAIGQALRRRTQRYLIAPFEAVGRIITPSHRAWRRAGDLMAELVRSGRISPGGFGRGFVNDCLLAASAAESGFVLISRNTRDFDLIRTVQPVDVVDPWPEAR